MFFCLCVYVCEGEKGRGSEKLGALCFVFFPSGDFPSICDRFSQYSAVKKNV